LWVDNLDPVPELCETVGSGTQGHKEVTFARDEIHKDPGSRIVIVVRQRNNYDGSISKDVAASIKGFVGNPAEGDARGGI
jgi:hypothetical protein